MTGLQEGASGMIIQPGPWANSFYPQSFMDLALFAGAGLAWSRRAAAMCLGVESVSAGGSPGGVQGTSELEIEQETKSLYVEQLYGDERCPHEEKAHLVSLLRASHESIASFWRDQRSASVPEIDAALWGLHVADGRLPDHVVGEEHTQALTAAIGETYKEMVRQLKEGAYSWKRQEGHRWMEAETYHVSVSKGSRVQHQLDEMHVVIDLLRLSCRLLQQILHARAQSPEHGVDDRDEPQLEAEVEVLIKSIPSSTRSDLANRFLDLYQRMAVLWSRNHVSQGPAAFKQAAELLNLLTYDLHNGRQFSRTFFNGILGQHGGRNS